MSIAVGEKAPGFTLLGSGGKSYSLSDYAGKPVVLVFYPGDQTPGCTRQLCAIRDDYSQFEAHDAVVFGINPQDQKSHKSFALKQHYQFPLLVDKQGQTVKAYGCKGPIMTTRTVYVIDKSGKIVLAQRGMPGTSELLKAIDGFQQ